MLTVYEIYQSVQGESTHVGRPCVFVRLAACDLRCSWCDTPYAFTGGKKMSVDDVLAAAATFSARLIAAGWEVLLETGGHLPIDDVPDDVVAIVDVKCPGSGEAGKMHWPNLDQLSPHDEVKFVIKDRADFDYAVDVIRRHDLTARAAAVLLSPVHGVLPPATLTEWLLESGLDARLQLQAHKYIWSPETRGV